MADSYAPLLKAIIARLRGYTGMSAFVSTRIYAGMPQNTEFPCVNVSIDSAPFDGQDFTGMEHQITVQVFSRKPTSKECADIRALVYAALNRQESNLTLDTYSVRHIHYNGIGFIDREPDGVTWQGLLTFRCVVT